MGPSGSGKSTLLHCMAGLDTPTSGRVLIDGTDLTGLNDKGLTRLRRDRIGFIFQSFNLVPTLTARENIELPLAIAGRHAGAAWLPEVVEAVGPADRLGHRQPQATEESRGGEEWVGTGRTPG